MSKLADKLWYFISYGQEIKPKDLPAYAKTCAEDLQADLVEWIDGHQVMIEPKQWYVDVKELKKMNEGAQ